MLLGSPNCKVKFVRPVPGDILKAGTVAYASVSSSTSQETFIDCIDLQQCGGCKQPSATTKQPRVALVGRQHVSSVALEGALTRQRNVLNV